MSLFHENKGGKMSYRRSISFLIIGSAIVFFTVDIFTDYKINETIWISLFGGGISIVLSTLIPKKNNPDEDV